ncbi:MAG TPA: EAL domain-containing protein [Baekduia sp.]|nr:EAL domain-containing protein [Baekduia sp.]
MPELEAAIREASDPQVVMQRVVDHALNLLPSAAGAVVELVDEDASAMTYVTTSGTLVGTKGTRLDIDNSLSGLSAKTNSTLVSHDTFEDDRVDKEACKRVGARSMVCVPLTPHGEILGVLKVTSPDASAFSGDDVVTLTNLAEFVTVAIAAASDLARVTTKLSGTSSLSEREFVANVIRPGIVFDAASRRRVVGVLESRGFSIALQPIFDVEDRAIVGYEALSRFDDGRPPDQWFEEAHLCQLGAQLELVAIGKALELLPEIREDTFLALNVSPAVVGHPEFGPLLSEVGPDRIVLELTEHFPVDDYRRLRTELIALRQAGMRIAIDDTGSGYTSLGHLLKLAPEIIKLDREFTHSIDRDPVRRSLAAALLRFGAETGSLILAEGVETEDEFAAVRELGIPYAQGYLLGRPAPISELDDELDAA